MGRIALCHGPVYYILKGPPTAPLVVLVHGFSQTADGWKTLAKEFLKGGCRTLTFDLYGSGRSACPKIEYTLEVYVEQTRQLLQHLRLDSATEGFTLVGSSMGGLIAAVFAHQYPDLVKRLLLINPAGLAIPLKEHFVNPKFLVSRLFVALTRSPVIGELISHAGIALVRDVLSHVAQPEIDSDMEEGVADDVPEVRSPSSAGSPRSASTPAADDRAVTAASSPPRLPAVRRPLFGSASALSEGTFASGSPPGSPAWSVGSDALSGDDEARLDDTPAPPTLSMPLELAEAAAVVAIAAPSDRPDRSPPADAPSRAAREAASCVLSAAELLAPDVPAPERSGGVHEDEEGAAAARAASPVMSGPARLAAGGGAADAMSGGRDGAGGERDDVGARAAEALTAGVPQLLRSLSSAVSRVGSGAALATLLSGLGVDGGLVREILHGVRNDQDGYRRALLSTIRNIGLMSDMTHVFEAIGAHPRPVLVIWGTSDSVLPYGCTQALARAMPNARRLTVPGAGHGPHACLVAGPHVAREALRFVLHGDVSTDTLSIETPAPAAAATADVVDVAAAAAGAPSAVPSVSQPVSCSPGPVPEVTGLGSGSGGTGAPARAPPPSPYRLLSASVPRTPSLSAALSEPAPDALSVRSGASETSAGAADSGGGNDKSRADGLAALLRSRLPGRQAVQDAVWWVGGLLAGNSRTVLAVSSVLAAVVTLGTGA